MYKSTHNKLFVVLPEQFALASVMESLILSSLRVYMSASGLDVHFLKAREVPYSSIYLFPDLSRPLQHRCREICMQITKARITNILFCNFNVLGSVLIHPIYYF